ncbi:MAG: inositol monophosphatase [Gammaproteobacteria bacterium]|nr:inositol monophosphatase [Gammaproteobacteria bacterium]
MPTTLLAIAHLLRDCARAEIVPRFQRVTAVAKADGSWLTDADTGMQQAVAQRLARDFPHYGFLGEEADAATQQACLEDTSRPFWVLDPLDGTSNFTAGIPFISTSLALIEHGRPVLGVVYDPLRDEWFGAQQGRGAWCNGAQFSAQAPPTPLAKGIGIVDFKRLSAPLATRLATAPPFSSQRSFGSVALDWCWLAAGRAHVYLHGGQRLWDYAAGYLILHEAGGQACTLSGEDVFQLTLQPRSALAAPTADLFHTWKTYVMAD